MGHECRVLTFDAKATKEQIRKRCDAWAADHVDRRETSRTTLVNPIQFTSQIFESEGEAEQFLNTTFGDYRMLAVRFKRPTGKVPQPTQRLMAVRKRVQDITARLQKYQKPHYAGVKSKTIGCKNCGSALATAYCGKTYGNNCPVCRADLRPPSTLDEIEIAQKQLKAAQKELIQLEREFQAKQTSRGYDLCWAVACEVHN